MWAGSILGEPVPCRAAVCLWLFEVQWPLWGHKRDFFIVWQIFSPFFITFAPKFLSNYSLQ